MCVRVCNPFVTFEETLFFISFISPFIIIDIKLIKSPFYQGEKPSKARGVLRLINSI